MAKQLLTRAVVTGLFMIGIAAGAAAGTIFFDDFSDGSSTNAVPADRNGAPVQWSPGFSVVAGDLVMQSTASVPITHVANLIVPSNVSLRAQMRLNTAGSIGLGARGHWALLNADGTASIGRFGTDVGLDVVATSFNPLAEEVIMQLDVVGTTFSVWLWKPSGPMPGQPVIRITDDFFGDSRIAVGGVSSSYPSASANFDAAFRFVHLADAPIPEPTSALLACLALAGLRGSTRRRTARL